MSSFKIGMPEAAVRFEYNLQFNENERSPLQHRDALGNQGQPQSHLTHLVLTPRTTLLDALRTGDWLGTQRASRANMDQIRRVPGCSVIAGALLGAAYGGDGHSFEHRRLELTEQLSKNFGYGPLSASDVSKTLATSAAFIAMGIDFETVEERRAAGEVLDAAVPLAHAMRSGMFGGAAQLQTFDNVYSEIRNAYENLEPLQPLSGKFAALLPSTAALPIAAKGDARGVTPQKAQTKKRVRESTVSTAERSPKHVRQTGAGLQQERFDEYPSLPPVAHSLSHQVKGSGITSGYNLFRTEHQETVRKWTKAKAKYMGGILWRAQTSAIRTAYDDNATVLTRRARNLNSGSAAE